MSNTEKDACSEGQTGEDIDVHVIAMAHFARALGALNDAMEDIDAMTKGDATEVKDRATELRRAMQSVLDERKRSDSIAQRERVGDGTGGEFDLGAAREEVERRLARIRRAKDGG